MTRFKDYFYGHKISDYGLQHGRVDYRTLANAFDAVFCKDLEELISELETFAKM